MTDFWKDPLFWCLIAAVLIGVFLTRRGRKAIAAQQSELSDLRNRFAAGEVLHTQAISFAEESADERTKTVLKSATRTLQSLAGEQQVVIDNLQRKYGGHPVLQELMEVNHANAQFARRAQAIAVICGGFLGRRKEPASVYDVIRGAQGQIRNFERVQIRSQSAFSVESKAVSGVALAIAELLANAANYSRPDTAIEVNIQPVHNGLCVIVDDFGVGMSDEQKQRATALLSGEFIPAMSDLGNPPQFGFPVIAELSRRYGFSVDVSSTSPYGGVRAVVRLPEELLTTETVERRSSPSVSTPAPIPAGVPASASEPSEPVEQPTGRTRSGLPKRASRQAPISIVRAAEEPDDTTTAPPSDGESRAAAARMGAFQLGTQTGRQRLATQPEGSERQ
jgi:two-component sensor histidine kinase